MLVLENNRSYWVLINSDKMHRFFRAFLFTNVGSYLILTLRHVSKGYEQDLRP